MKHRVVAIGLDSVGPSLLDRYISAGALPRIQRLRERGACSVLVNRAEYAGGSAPQSITEGLWVEFQTGVHANKSGYWTSFRYDPHTYEARSDPVHGGYDYREFAPFYALGSDYRVATFDVPVSALSEQVDGLQLVGWSGHYPFVVPGSRPEGLLEEITSAYGRSEILYRDAGVFWDRKYLHWLERASIATIRARTRICLDLMDRERWDLLLAVFGEIHGPLHDLWFAADADHPVHAAWSDAYDPVSRVLRALDDAVGAIADRVDDDAFFVLFSVNGSGPNVADAACFFLLPELLYRFQHPGRIRFADGNASHPLPPPLLRSRQRTWYGEIWKRRHVDGRLRRRLNGRLPPWLVGPTGEDFRFPYRMDRIGAECGWMPAQWYQPAWRRMRSFALPAFADGHVRINLAGREADGVLAADEYPEECARVTAFLRRVRHGRSGRPLVRNVCRTRRSGDDEDPRYPNADLVVIFADEPVDVVDSPDVGRVGPVPYYRTGGHRPEGFAIATGPGIEAGRTVTGTQAVDLGPTMLEMLGAHVPSHFDGRSWLGRACASR